MQQSLAEIEGIEEVPEEEEESNGVPEEDNDDQPLKKQATLKMTNNLADGFLKMLKSNNNIDDRTMALIARASSVKKVPKSKASTAPVVYEQNMLADIDKIEEDTPEKNGTADQEQAKPLLLGGLQNNKIQSEDDDQSDPAKKLAEMLRPKIGLGGGWASLHQKVHKKRLFEEDQVQV